VPARQVAQENWLMQSVAVLPTKDRSVLGQLIDFAKLIPFHLANGDWGETDLRRTEDKLGRTPCLCSAKGSQTLWPIDETLKLLAVTWE